MTRADWQPGRRPADVSSGLRIACTLGGVAGRPPLRIELLGGFRVLEEGRAPSRAPSVRQQQIIALLILQARRGPIPRQRVAGFLWPDSSDEQALTNLRRAFIKLPRIVHIEAEQLFFDERFEGVHLNEAEVRVRSDDKSRRHRDFGAS